MRTSGMTAWVMKATISSTVPVGPVFDKREIGIRLGCGGGPRAMIPLLLTKIVFMN